MNIVTRNIVSESQSAGCIELLYEYNSGVQSLAERHTRLMDMVSHYVSRHVQGAACYDVIHHQARNAEPERTYTVLS